MKKWHYFFVVWLIYVSFITGQLVEKIGDISKASVYTWHLPAGWIFMSITWFAFGYLVAKARYKF